jgi:hypothetical protein
MPTLPPWRSATRKPRVPGWWGRAELNPQQLRLLHRAYREILVPCLAEHGYPSKEPVSEDEFVESKGEARVRYALIPPRQVAEVEQLCPQDIVTLLVELGRRNEG